MNIEIMRCFSEESSRLLFTAVSDLFKSSPAQQSILEEQVLGTSQEVGLEAVMFEKDQIKSINN